MKIVNAEQMRELEKRADGAGISYAGMMERAGTLTAHAVMDKWEVRDKRILVLVGPGNNGGDGLVAARVLSDAGASVRLYVWKREPDENDVNWRLCRERNITALRAEDDADFALLKGKLQHADFVIDALLGTGVARPIGGELQGLLDAVRGAVDGTRARPPLVSPTRPSARPSRRPMVVAIDLPTGLNPDTGALDSAAVHADMTVTFAFPKVGHYAMPGANAVGELVVADIGIPPEWAETVAVNVATADEIGARLPERARDSNKGTFGKVMLACGSLNYTGAPVLAARAAGRAGAGLVTLAVPQALQAIIASKIDEATFLSLPDRAGDWRPRAANELLAALWDSSYDALVVGCGLGRADSTGEFLQRLLENLPTLEEPPALVLDADALNWLAEMPDWWTSLQFASPPILTPHPGEMARLLGVETAEVQADRIETARAAAQNWNAVVVLKGAFTVIAAPDGQVTLLPFANPALATAGTGDVLAGTIGGILAQVRAAKGGGAGSGERGAEDEGQDNGQWTMDDGQGEDEAPDNERRGKKKDKRRATLHASGQAPDGGRTMEDPSLALGTGSGRVTDDEEVSFGDMYAAAVIGGFVHGLAGELAAEEIGNAGVVAGDVGIWLPRAMRELRGR